MARLGHQRLQPQPALRPVHRETARRGPATGATLEDKVATGFNRNNIAGLNEEEYGAKSMLNRGSTTLRIG